MTRILQVSDVYRPNVGGIEVFVGDLAARQAASGHDVTLLTPTCSTGPEPEEGFRVLRTGLGPALAGGLVRGHGPGGAYDVVHAHLSVLSPFSTLVARAAVAAGIPTVLTVHSMIGDRRWVLRTVGRVVGWHRWPAVWTTVSEAAASDLRALPRGGVPVTVVSNAIDVEWWRAAPAAVLPAGVGGQPLTILSVMRLVPRKRPLALLSMLASVRRRVDERVPLAAVVVGDGPLAGRMQEELEAQGLAGWVTLTGGLDRFAIRGLCGSADIYAAPATHEAFGIAALEARTAGVPVVAMRGGGVRDFVDDGIEGLLVDDDPGMAAALAALAGDPALRTRMAEHNRQTAPRADWPQTVVGFDRVYAAAASTAARQRASRTGSAGAWSPRGDTMPSLTRQSARR